MNEIEVVIKISEEAYKVLTSDLYFTFPVMMKKWGLRAIRNGKPLDELRGKIEYHRMKTKSIDPYDLVGDCLYFINKFMEESEDKE